MVAALLDDPGSATMRPVQRAPPAAISGHSVAAKVATLRKAVQWSKTDTPGRDAKADARNEFTPQRDKRRRAIQAACRRACAGSRKRLRPPRLLTYVDAVARHGSIRKAAEALNVAPSALNRQILDLEIDLGSALFERLPRGMRLTAAGEVFLAYTRQAISELKAIDSQVEQLRGLVRGQVSVAAVELVVGELLPAAITQLSGGASQCALQRPYRRSRGVGLVL